MTIFRATKKNDRGTTVTHGLRRIVLGCWARAGTFLDGDRPDPGGPAPGGDSICDSPTTINPKTEELHEHSHRADGVSAVGRELQIRLVPLSACRAARRRGPVRKDQAPDRKSTRLNSSHIPLSLM